MGIAMNPKIKALAEQVDPEMAKEMVYCTQADLQKFAGLIIHECASRITSTDLEDVEGGDSAVLYAAATQVKNYFGIE